MRRMQADFLEKRAERYSKLSQLAKNTLLNLQGGTKMENKDMFSSLGNMYIANKRFTAYYEKFAPELAAYYNDAIQHYCITNA